MPYTTQTTIVEVFFGQSFKKNEEVPSIRISHVKVKCQSNKINLFYFRLVKKLTNSLTHSSN